MPVPNDNAPRSPFVESLESRQLFATTPLPDLVPTLTSSLAAVIRPGSNLTSTLQITNNGAAITKKTYVPIRLYVSPTRTLDSHAKPFKTIQRALTLGAGASDSATLTYTLPSAIKSKKYFLIILVNNRQALAESNKDNNTVVSSRIANPVGSYTGNFSASDHRPGSLSLSLTPNNSTSSTTASLLTDVNLDSDGFRFHLSKAKSNISGTGFYHLKDSGSYHVPSRGKITYYINIKADLSGDTLTGTFQFHWHTNTASRTANGTYTIERP